MPKQIEAWKDEERETWPLESVERYDGGYEISFDRGMGTIISDDRNPENIPVKVGDLYTSWGRGFGSRYRGQAINGMVLWYRTQEEDDADFHAEVERSQQKRREEWEAGKEDYFARIAALPEVFRERIAVRQRNNPDFDWEFGQYELFCCEQAVMMANVLGSQEAVQSFADLPWEEQKTRLPELSDQHSGNTFGASVALANRYLESPESVPLLRGALSPLVGSCDYGDVPPDHEFCASNASAAD